MATVIAPVSAQLRRRVLPAGAVLLAAEALDLVNVPAANSLAQQAHEWVKSLKAPANNDRDAQELTCHIDRYTRLVEAAANFVNNVGAAHQDESKAKFLLQLQGFYEYLSGLRAELDGLQDERPLVKLACQTDIKSRLDEKREEILNQAILFCLEIGLFANCTVAQFYEMQRSSNERFRQLECQVSALCLARRTDERCSALHSRHVFF